MLPQHPGDGSCKLWDRRTLACLHALAGESGGVTSCHLALTSATQAPDLQQTVLVSPPRPGYRPANLLSARRVKKES